MSDNVGRKDTRKLEKKKKKKYSAPSRSVALKSRSLIKDWELGEVIFFAGEQEKFFFFFLYNTNTGSTWRWSFCTNLSVEFNLVN